MPWFSALVADVRIFLWNTHIQNHVSLAAVLRPKKTRSESLISELFVTADRFESKNGHRSRLWYDKIHIGFDSSPHIWGLVSNIYPTIINHHHLDITGMQNTTKKKRHWDDPTNGIFGIFGVVIPQKNDDAATYLKSEKQTSSNILFSNQWFFMNYNCLMVNSSLRNHWTLEWYHPMLSHVQPIWRFPEMRVPLNHPWDFPLSTIQRAWGTTMTAETPDIPYDYPFFFTYYSIFLTFINHY